MVVKGNDGGMRLLILTQVLDKEDEGVLGFFHDWVREFAKRCDSLIVVCLKLGEYDLPDNVKVFSLGKESGESVFKYVFRFYKYIIQHRKDYDSVFVHMNQVYVLLGGLLWKVWKKKIGLWYAHGHVSLSLRVAEKVCDLIFTPSPKSFRLKSNKLNIVGHGINLSQFDCPLRKTKSYLFKILSVGRISPIKNYEVLIKAIYEIKKNKFLNLSVQIVGEADDSEQKTYLKTLKDMVGNYNLEETVEFVGPVKYNMIAKFYSQADLFVHTSNTGSLDKVVLEAMASGLKVLSCNEAICEILNNEIDDYIFENNDHISLSKKILRIISNKDSDTIGGDFWINLAKKNSLTGCIDKIYNKII